MDTLNANPFEGTDDEMSSVDEISTIFEEMHNEVQPQPADASSSKPQQNQSESDDHKQEENGNNDPLPNDNVFDFEKWIVEYKLGDVKQCFIDHNMNDLDSLNLNNSNFAQLTGDARILAKAYLIKNIVDGIQSLQSFKPQPVLQPLQQQQHQKSGASVQSLKSAKSISIHSLSDNAEGAMPVTTRPSRNRLIFMTQHENRVFQGIQRYIDKVSKMQNDLKIVTFQEFETKKEKNLKYIENYEKLHLNVLDQLEQKIHAKFEQLHHVIDTQKNALVDVTNEQYQPQVERIMNRHNDEMRAMDRKLKETLTKIDDDKYQFADLMDRCKNVIKKYDENEEEKDNMEDEQFSFAKLADSSKRETEIVAFGNMAKAHYEKRCSLFQQHQDDIETFNRTQLNLPEQPLHSVAVNEKVYNAICYNVSKFIYMKCTDPQHANMVVKVDENKEHTDSDVDDIDNKEHNDESKHVDGDDDDKEGDEEMLQFVNSTDRGDVNSEVVKKFNSKCCNGEKWEIKENDTLLSAIPSEPTQTFYAIYFGEKGYEKGVYSISVKGVKQRDPDGIIKCCIGVISVKEEKWISDGMSNNWPSDGVSAHFDGWKNDDGWYSGDTMTVQLDLNQLTIYYYIHSEITEDENQKLIKKETIEAAKEYYFVMVPDLDPFVEYYIQ
eukprot:CAMPEP_0197037872 /NCGR_PEP_ID=MMETSP1384-20130603/14973_1 /TAXON_ID=29189 /ORGANISM="Ammonia sp." /LENGTH=662 /DNA_ID=CAMNT_0042468245 /DNA_START=54 /DNA_END=2042 /DNA_ORIENTATION=-